MRGQAVYSVAALAAAVLFLAATASAQPRTSVASRMQIAIHEQGTSLTDPKLPFDKRYPHGTFVLDLAGLTPSPSGTTIIIPQPGATRYVDGETQIPFAGTNKLTSKTGQLELAFKGIHIDVNSKLGTNGQATGPGVEYGTWTVRSGTGTYKGWKGGGIWASASYGYGRIQPYSVEWNGYITR